MANVWPVSLNVCLVNYIRTLYRGHGHLQGNVFPRGLEIRIYVIIITSRAKKLIHIFLFYVEESYCNITSGTVCSAQVFAGFSGHGKFNLQYLLKKEKCILIFFSQFFFRRPKLISLILFLFSALLFHIDIFSIYIEFSFKHLLLFYSVFSFF